MNKTCYFEHYLFVLGKFLPDTSHARPAVTLRGSLVKVAIRYKWITILLLPQCPLYLYYLDGHCKLVHLFVVNIIIFVNIGFNVITMFLNFCERIRCIALEIFVGVTIITQNKILYYVIASTPI